MANSYAKPETDAFAMEKKLSECSRQHVTGLSRDCLLLPAARRLPVQCQQFAGFWTLLAARLAKYHHDINNHFPTPPRPAVTAVTPALAFFPRLEQRFSLKGVYLTP